MKTSYKVIFFLSIILILHGCIRSTAPKFSKEIEQPEANFILYVSNQSYDKPKIDISIIIDGKVLTTDTFRVKNQHFWKMYSLNLVTGKHLLKATADNGAYEIERDFKITEKHWAVLSFWFKNESTNSSGLSFDISDEPYGFL